MPSKYALLILSLLTLHACRRDNNVAFSHPGYFDQVFRTAERLKNTNPERTFAFVDSAFRAFPHPGISDLYRAYSFKVGILIDQKDTLALLYVDSALWIIREHSDDKEFISAYGAALSTKAYLLMDQEKYTDAFECAYKARQVVEKTGDTCLLSDYTFLLAGVSNRQGKYLDAARYDRQGLEELSHCNDHFGKFKFLQAKLDDIGIYYTRSGMPDSALYYFTADVRYLHQNADSFPVIPGQGQFAEYAMAVVHGNMGDVYYKKGDTAAAEQLYKESIRINNRYDLGDAQSTQTKLASLYLAENRLTDARNVLQQLKNSLLTQPNSEIELRWYRLQFDFLRKAGKMKDAYSLILPYLALKDSLENKTKIPQVDVAKEYEHLRTDYNLALLEKKDELKDFYLAIVLIISTLTLIIALLLWQNWKRSKKLNYKIIRQNDLMRRSLNALEQSQSENTRIMKIVAHDLRSPIAATISISTLLLEGDRLCVEDREMLELVKTSGLQSIEMITDLLNMNTRPEGMKKESVEMHTLLHYCIDLLQFRASEKRQKITLEAQDVVMDINREKIWRVVSNLIVNAIKFSPEETTIDVHMHREGNGIRIMIRDRGIGIPDNLKSKIFEMFTEAKRLGTSGEPSFGLGLAICRTIVEAHHGKIWFETEEGKGTAFYIYIPMFTDSPHSLPQARHHS